MKLSNLYIGLGMSLVTGIMASCSSDYLDQPPITQFDSEEVSTNIVALQAAVNGACQAMYIAQYADNNDRNMCGEPWIQTYYGDAGSPDFWDSFLWGYQAEMQNWSLMLQNTWYASRNMWMYGYNLVGQANLILDAVDTVDAEQDLKDFVKAQALTIRAHGYIRMMQVYAPRWEDQGEDGYKYCLILRDKPGTESMGLSSYKDCIAFIENDLDTAIALYQGAPNQRRTMGYQPDLSVAQGLYSRIALLNHEWTKARDMAAAARTNYPIMSADDYKAGFADPTSEWIWYNDPGKDYVGYNGWGASYSCNGYYACAYNWSGAGCISLRLYDAIYSRHNDDVRCELFWTPDKMNKYANYGLKEEYFWDPEFVNEDYEYMYGYTSSSVDLNVKYMSAAISLFAKNMNPNPEAFTEAAFGVDTSVPSNRLQVTNWYNSLPEAQNSCQPGAQLKFWSYPSELYAVSHPFLRSSELLLTEAEAEMELGNESKVRELLVELNNNRILSGYTCNLSGDALREEVRLYRRMELWGEGDCWFSFKRWNVSVTRDSWIANDPTSDTFLPSYAGTWDPDYGSENYRQGGGWRFRIPSSETNYNAIVVEQLNEN